MTEQEKKLAAHDPNDEGTEETTWLIPGIIPAEDGIADEWNYAQEGGCGRRILRSCRDGLQGLVGYEWI